MTQPLLNHIDYFFIRVKSFAFQKLFEWFKEMKAKSKWLSGLHYEGRHNTSLLNPDNVSFLVELYDIHTK